MDQSRATESLTHREFYPRETPDQIKRVPVPMPSEFDHVQFPGFVGKMESGTRGDLRFTITVPARWRYLAIDLFHATGVPCSIDIQRWSLADH